MKKQTQKWPLYGTIGLAVIAVSWFFNWNLTGLRTHYFFFPLWTGYILFIDAVVFMRKGHSLLKRDYKAFIALFFISAPAWWLFELINLRLQNWQYLGREHFSALQYALYASLNFSTVIPAVFETSELIGSFKWSNRLRSGPGIAAKRQSRIALFLGGIILLILILVWPRYFFPMIWPALFLILDPLNIALDNPSQITKLSRGNWRAFISLALGCLVCGFFWELWNFYAYPKWIYHIPFVDFCRIFEMPVLGYLGYIGFAWELFAIYHLIAGLIPALHRDYVQI